jgi:hypothetical protein
MPRQAAAVLTLLLGLAACSRNERDTRAASAAAARGSPSSAATMRGVVLAAGGRSRLLILAPKRLEEPAAVAAVTPPRRQAKVRLTPAQQRASNEAELLKASIRDLVGYLGRISGTEVELRFGPPEASTPADRVTLLLGELGASRYGALSGHTPGNQAFRVVIQPSAIGLFGESDVSTSYAIYELLDRLGCRWFMPGALGEDIPSKDPLAVTEADDTLSPSTLYRDIWYADPDFKRRNRLGGLKLEAGHMLERWVTQADRDEHPEFKAQIAGVTSERRLRWSSPELAKVMAANISAKLAKKPADSVSLSPGDGIDFDESDDRALDANDWDPSVNSVSLTDRLMSFANRVATELQPQHPDLMLGVLAYASYTRPPVREQVHPNVVPVIAPITYCRVHPWSDDGCPGARDARRIVEGWAAHSARLAFRGYGYNLSEPAAPFPLLRKWSEDLPYLFAHKTRFFQPETLPNFETTLPGLYLAIRLSWNAQQNPAAILNDLFDHFYGHASQQARQYWELLDQAWTNTPEFAGGGLGHPRRFTPQFLEQARKSLAETQLACRTESERARVAMLDASLSQLELYMGMDARFKRGDVGHLATDLARWLEEAYRLADFYASNAAFAKTAWAHGSVYASYVKRFLEPIYLEIDRIHREQLLLSMPSCNARYRLAPELKLPVAGPPVTLGETDRVTNFCQETWSTLGHYDYFGAMWYELELDASKLPAGKRAYLTLTKVDGAAQVWLNGVLIKPTRPTGTSSDSAEVHLSFLSYELTPAVHAGETNRLTVAVQRTRLAELGAGGLLGPLYTYRDR